MSAGAAIEYRGATGARIEGPKVIRFRDGRRLLSVSNLYKGVLYDMATVVGVFSSHEQAEKAVRSLQDKGFTKDDISIAARDDRQGSGDQNEGEGQGENGFGFEAGGDMGMSSDSVTDGTAWGGALGGLAGLLAGVGALAIPGIGPIVAAGPLAAALSGAVAGGVAGGLIDFGIPEQEGRRYENELKQGNALAIIKAEGDKAEIAESILQQSGANEVQVFDGNGSESH